jgi:(2R)-sulfolactate sulfo-lyase subunit alpha
MGAQNTAHGADKKPGSTADVPHVFAHNPKDNVAVVVVEGLKAGTEALGVVTENNSTFRILVKDDIPIGHKVALTDLKTADTAIKYGEDVGRITADVAKGRHVHTHNLKTKRW